MRKRIQQMMIHMNRKNIPEKRHLRAKRYMMRLYSTDDSFHLEDGDGTAFSCSFSAASS